MIGSAGEGCVRVVDLTIFVAIKDAQRGLFTCPIRFAVIGLHRRHIWIVRSVVVVVEIASVRANPQLRPAESLLPRLDVLVRGTGNDHVVGVALAEHAQMRRHLIDMKAAPVAWRVLLTRPEHEMIYNQLALAVEEFIERDGSIGPCEHVFLVHLDHRHVGTERGNFVGVPRMLFLLFQEINARFAPFFWSDDLG